MVTIFMKRCWPLHKHSRRRRKAFCVLLRAACAAAAWKRMWSRISVWSIGKLRRNLAGISCMCLSIWLNCTSSSILKKNRDVMNISTIFRHSAVGSGIWKLRYQIFHSSKKMHCTQQTKQRLLRWTDLPTLLWILHMQVKNKGPLRKN